MRKISACRTSMIINDIIVISAMSDIYIYQHLSTSSFYFPCRNSQKKAHVYGFTYSFSQAMIYFAYAACFRFGAWLIEAGRINVEGVFL